MRCKERHRLMKDAVYARHHLAAAHSEYCHCLRLTGSALYTFAAAEPLTVAEDTPAVLLHKTTNDSQSSPRPPPSATASASPKLPRIVTSGVTRRRQQPSRLPHVLSEPSLCSSPRSEFSNFSAAQQQPEPEPSPTSHPPQPPLPAVTRRRKPPPKLPHILSESSLFSSPRSEYSNFFATAHQAQSTPTSQTSSVWNWENFHPPPSPPGSDYFRQRQNHKQQTTTNFETSESESESMYNPFRSNSQRNRKIDNSTNVDSQEQKAEPEISESETESEEKYLHEPVQTEREEVRCSEWEDRYSSSSSSEQEEGGVGVTSPSKAQYVAGGYAPGAKNEKVSDNVAEAKVAVRHRDLKEIVEAVRENFEKAAVAGDQLSEMLEVSRAHLDQSFKQLRSKAFRVLQFAFSESAPKF